MNVDNRMDGSQVGRRGADDMPAPCGRVVADQRQLLVLNALYERVGHNPTREDIVQASDATGLCVSLLFRKFSSLIFEITIACRWIQAGEVDQKLDPTETQVDRQRQKVRFVRSFIGQQYEILDTFIDSIELCQWAF